MDTNKIHKIGAGSTFLMYATYESDLFCSFRGKFFILPNPIEKARRMGKRIQRSIFNALFVHNVDIDCDGMSESIYDRLTMGKLYYFNGWNFTRVGGMFGYYKRIMGIDVTRHEN